MHFLSVIKYSTHDTLSPLQTYTCSQIYRKVDFGRAKSFKDSNVNNKLFFTKFFRKFHNSLEVLKHDSVVTSYNPLTQQCVFPWYYMVKIRQKITFIAHYHCVQVKRLFFILIKHKKNDMYTIFLSRHSIGDIPSALWCHKFKSSLLLCPVQFHFIP